MLWILWVVVGLMVVGSITNITQIGKPRPATTPEVAAIIVPLDVLFILAIIFIGIIPQY